MTRILWMGVLLGLLALMLPSRAWALRCGSRIVGQGDSMAQVREECGAPFFADRYVGPPGVGVDTPVEPGAAVTSEVWYYNFGPQQLMVRLEFSGGVLARERTLGYGFVGRGGPCDFTHVTTGMSVADLIARCGFPADRARNDLAIAAYAGPRAGMERNVVLSGRWFAKGTRGKASGRVRGGRANRQVDSTGHPLNAPGRTVRPAAAACRVRRVPRA